MKNQNIKQVILMNGNPLSGKSTLVAEFKKQFEENDETVSVLKTVSNRDPKDLVKFTKDSIDETIPATKKSKDDSYEMFIPQLNETTSEINILDATFHIKYRRDAIYKYCKENNLPLTIVSVTCSNDEEIKETLRHRQENPDTKDNILSQWEQYACMKEQSNPMTENELKQEGFEFPIISFNRTTKELTTTKETPFVNRIMNIIKNFKP